MKHIELAHEMLDEQYECIGCCDILGLNGETYYVFSNMLRPRCLNGKRTSGVDGNYSYWLGKRIEGNLPLRHHFIDTFAGIILADKGYKDLEKYYYNDGWLK